MFAELSLPYRSETGCAEGVRDITARTWSSLACSFRRLRWAAMLDCWQQIKVDLKVTV
jgi:hypothetical protein